jgi:hypothetical protein
MPLEPNGIVQFSDFPAPLSIDGVDCVANRHFAGFSSLSPANDWG